MSWSQEQVTELINQYKKHPCLYAVKTKEYKNRHARAKALDVILSHITKIKSGVTVADIKNKFNGIKSNFMTEHKKVVASKKSGAGDDDVYIPTLWYYNHLFFVLEHNMVRQSFDSINTKKEQEIDEEVVEEDFEISCIVDEESLYNCDRDTVGDKPFVSPTVSCPSCSSRKRKVNNEDELISSACTAMKTLTNAVDNKSTAVKSDSQIFGDFVASKLEKIKTEDARLEAEFEITKILYEAIKK